MDGTTISQAAYARHRGVSRQAISKLVNSGRIPVKDDGTIDAAEADFALGETHLRLNEAKPPPAGMTTGGEGAAGLTKARTADAVYQAKLRELEYNKETGKLLDTNDVRIAMERCAEKMVREIDQIPAFADDLAAAVTRNGVAGLRDALRVKARALRATLARTMTLMADGVDDEESAEKEAA